MENKNQFDVIIIGGSYAGLAAAMSLGRALRKVLIIDSGAPCNLQTPYSHNFLTNDGKMPREISIIAKAEVEKYSTIKIINRLAVSGLKTNTGFEINDTEGTTYLARILIFATGIKDFINEIPGYAECWGISVLHCPYCHGYEVKNKKTGIIGNGIYGFEFSFLIYNWTDDLTLYTNGKSSLTEKQTSNLKYHHINIVETEINQLKHHNGYVQQIQLKNGNKLPVSVIYARSPFVQHCNIPELLGCEISEEGYINIDHSHKTTIEGVYACGDNVTRIRTVANAVSMGTITGMMVNKQLIEEDFKPKKH